MQLLDTGTPGVSVAITGAEGNATNLGQIISEAGRIGMAGVLVTNSGTLNASSVVKEGGRIFLKASDNIVLNAGSKLSATSSSGRARQGEGGGSINVTSVAAVLNFGSIDADAGGSVSMQADHILQTGAISATGGGNITLSAQQGVIQTENAQLDVSNASGPGGTIGEDAGLGRLFSSAAIDATGATGGAMHLSGQDIYLMHGHLDASGKQGGGSILIGGDAHGARILNPGEANPAVQNALSTYVNPTTTINADATVSGEGGKIVIWSEQDTKYFGSLSAKGGTLVETAVSSKFRAGTA